MSIFVTESPPPPELIGGSTVAMSVSGTTATTLSLTSYFMYATSYAVVSDPIASGASISGSTLSVTGAFRNTSYVIIISASNVAGTSSATLTVSVTEDTYTTRTLLMYDASTLTGDSGSVVSSWPNVSSLGSTFNVTSVNSPKVIVDTNGKGIDFTSSTSQRFSLSTSSTLCSLNKFVQSGGVYGGATVVLVVKFRAPRVMYERLLSLSSSTSTNNQIFVGRADTYASYASDIYNGSTSINSQVFFITKVSGATAIVEGVAQIFVTTYANISATQHQVQHYINSSTPFEMDISPIRTGTISNRTLDRIDIGCFAGNTNFTNAIIYQAMVFNEVLSTAGIAAIVEDLKSKWNIQTYTPPPPPELIYVSVVSKTISDMTANNKFDLTAYFRFATSYTLISNPQSSASISGSRLTVYGMYRNMTYNVIVSASNAAGTCSSTMTFTITETADTSVKYTYMTSLGSMPTTNSLSVNKTFSGNIYTVSTAELPEYGSIGQVFNTNGFIRSYGSKYTFVGTGQYNPYSGSVTTTASGTALSGLWIQLKLPSQVRITKYSFKPVNTDDPAKWYMVGSNDNATWTLLDSKQYLTVPGIGSVTTFALPTPGYYMYYRFIVNAISGTTIHTTMHIQSFSISSVV